MMKYKKIIFNKFVIIASLLILVGCSVINNRINVNKIAFSNLSVAEKDLVKQGKICIGMDVETVRMALGNPDYTVKNKIDDRYIDNFIYGREKRSIVFIEKYKVVGWIGLNN